MPDWPNSEQEQSGSVATEEAPFYCPGCGRRFNYRTECEGKPVAPHPAIEVVSTEELSGDPANHTPAPSTENVM